MGAGVASDKIHVLSQNELKGAMERSGRIRAYCPIHGGDKQRSLSIAAYGDMQGWGHCHSCNARVLLAELRPDIAARLGYVVEGGAVTAYRPLDTRPDWQINELDTLQAVYAQAQVQIQRARPSAYLAQRGIPSLELAHSLGLAYLPPWSDLSEEKRELIKPIRKWCDRVILPLSSRSGQGFIGRALHLWEVGMDEYEHRRVIEGHNARIREYNAQIPEGGKRGYELHAWTKTSPAGYFNAQILQRCKVPIFVEGGFDALALLAAGIQDVIATCGTSLDGREIPTQIYDAILALDIDGPGKDASKKLKRDLEMKGIDVTLWSAPEGKGKDWSECYRVHGISALVMPPEVKRLLSSELAPLSPLPVIALVECPAATRPEVAQIEAEAEDIEPFLCSVCEIDLGGETDYHARYDETGEVFCGDCWSAREGMHESATVVEVNHNSPGALRFEAIAKEAITMLEKKTRTTWQYEIFHESEREQVRARVLEEYRRKYTPYSLPLLPRAECPGEAIIDTRDSRKLKLCTDRPERNGWCKHHQGAAQLLEMGAILGYPVIEHIGEGIVWWELFARRSAPQRLGRALQIAQGFVDRSA